MDRRKASSRLQNPVIIALVILLVLGGIAGLWYYESLKGQVYIENAEIKAPLISLGPSVPGILEKVYVQEGDEVGKAKAVALVGDELIYPKVHGTIVTVNNNPGQVIAAGTPVVQMIDDQELRVVGHIDENRGLSELRPGQRVLFTVDAFGNKKFEGQIDSIRPTASQSDIAFSISDKRQERQFDVSIRYDILTYPDLRNGMSARMWVYP